MRLVIVHDDQRPPVAGLFGRLGFRARWWCVGDDIFTTWRHRSSVPGIAHEVEHLTCADFASNVDHHPSWHLCGRAVPVIGTRHLSAASVAIARKLVG